MNLNNLQILLQEAIDNATQPVDWLLLSKAIQALNVGQVRTVATYANLPSAAANEGLLVFVTADERLYWSTGTDWYNLIDENKGLAWAWGSNNVGQVGDNTTTSRLSPVSVVGGFTDWCQVSASASCCHTLAVRSNGTVWSWGWNQYGQLGSNNTTSARSPVSVVGGFTDWCQASAGGKHSLAVRCNCTLWSWGSSSYGQLGNNSYSAQSSPVSVVGGFTDWCQASAGGNHSLAIRTNCTLWSWGYNFLGQLGDNTGVDRSSPVSVVGGFADWCQASAGTNHSVAVRTNGTLWVWGFNAEGGLGDGTTINRSSPVSIVGGFTDWCQASAGFSHTLALRTNGTLWSWGSNASGKLGDGTTSFRCSPVSVVGGFTDWCQVSAGGNHSLASRSNGTAWAWGFNNAGQLGDSTSTSRSSPVSVVGGFADWCLAAAGTSHSVALRKTNFT